MATTVDWLEERLAGRYPREVTIGGLPLVLAPMVPSDWGALQRFLEATPRSERLFFRHRLSDSERIERWCSELDYRHVFPLIAWSGDAIVADAGLMQEPDLWTSHVGRLRLLVHPDYRGRGVGTAMIRELIDVGRQLGLHKLVHECAGPQTELITLLSNSGFREAARLPEFVRAQDGGIHDLVMMVH